MPDRPGLSDSTLFVLRSCAIAVAALLLRLYQLGAQPLWYDEAFSWNAAVSPGLFAEMPRENSALLFYALLRAAMAVFGDGEAAIRLVSALAGGAFVLALIWAARELFDRRVALVGGALGALSPLHLYYSQEARSYSLLALLLVLSFAAALRAARTDGARWWALFGAAAFLACATHYFAAFGLLACVGPVLAARDRRRLVHFCLASCACAGVGAWALVAQMHAVCSTRAFDALRTAWEATPPLLAVPHSLELFVLGPQSGVVPIFFKQLAELSLSTPLRALGLAAASALALAGLSRLGDARLGLDRLGARKAILVAALLVPLVALWLVSALLRPVYLVGRYDLVAFPAAPIVLALGAAKLLWAPRGVVRALGALAVAGLVAPIAVKLAGYFTAKVPQDSQATAQIVHQAARSGDVVVFTGPRGLPTLYYLDLLGDRRRATDCVEVHTGRRYGCRLFPREREVEVTAFSSLEAGRQQGTREAARADVHDFLGALAAGGEVFVALGETQRVQGAIIPSKDEQMLLFELAVQGLAVAPFEPGMSILRLRRAAPAGNTAGP
jgi:mannosyltransferase